MKQCEVAVHMCEQFRRLANMGQMEVVEREDYLSIRGGEGFNYIIGIGKPPSKNTRRALYPKEQGKPLASIWCSTGYDDSVRADLLADGFIRTAPLSGVALELKEFAVEPPSVEVVSVKSETDYLIWCKIFALTWKRPFQAACHFFRSLQEDGGLFVAKVDGRIVGSGALGIHGEVAGCYWTCVLPEYRRLGIGTAMYLKRLAVAKEQGCQLMVAHCLNSSLGIYQRLGFEKRCEMALFQYSP